MTRRAGGTECTVCDPAAPGTRCVQGGHLQSRPQASVAALAIIGVVITSPTPISTDFNDGTGPFSTDSDSSVTLEFVDGGYRMLVKITPGHDCSCHPCHPCRSRARRAQGSQRCRRRRTTIPPASSGALVGIRSSTSSALHWPLPRSGRRGGSVAAGRPRDEPSEHSRQPRPRSAPTAVRSVRPDAAGLLPVPRSSPLVSSSTCPSRISAG